MLQQYLSRKLFVYAQKCDDELEFYDTEDIWVEDANGIGTGTRMYQVFASYILADQYYGLLMLIPSQLRFDESTDI